MPGPSSTRRSSTRLSLVLLGLLVCSLVAPALAQTAAMDFGSMTFENAGISVALVGETDSTRTLRHAFGETQVPVQPERVLHVGGDSTIDALMALGVPLVGYTEYPLNARFYLERLGEAERVGDSGQPDFEKVLLLHPDLIVLEISELDESMYRQLSKIAPTIPIFVGADPYITLQSYAVALGREAEAEAFIGAYKQEATELGEALRAKFGNETFANIAIFDPSNALLYGLGGSGGILYGDLGLAAPTAKIATDYATEFSYELLPDYTIDNIVLNSPYDDENEGLIADVIGTPLWQALPAVKAGKVYTIPWWSLTNGLLARRDSLPHIRSAFLEGN